VTKPAEPLVSIVDDDLSVREATAGLVSLMRLRVAVFSSGVEFLASPCVGETACLVADVNMPEMTGLELHIRLRRLGHRIPTVLITAYPTDELRARAAANGVLAFLTKPFDGDVLLGWIRAALAA
jgi:FixJ family two-component response regulator